MADIAVLLFLLQQLGLTLGLGAATFSLMFYVLGLRDGGIDETEQRFIHATRTVLALSLFLIVLTGALVTAAHLLADERIIVMAPVYLAKWMLIAIIVLNGALLRFKAYSPLVGGVISGASWYALFIVHTLVPDVSWSVLGIGYALWIGIFALGFAAVRKGVERGEIERAPQPVQIPVSGTPAPQPRPVPASKFVPTEPAAHKPAPPIEFDLHKTIAATAPQGEASLSNQK